jgi:hypothetical protein
MARQYFFTGTAAPTTTPTYAGSLFVDTTADKIYFATGTTSSADWDPLPINLSDLTIDSDLALGGLYKIKKALGMDFQPASELTIATGAVTQTQSVHTVDTQSDAASDDLDTITIATDMSVLYAHLENAARIVTLKHGTGNLNLPDDADIVMAENTVYFLLYNGTAWNLVGSSGSGSGDVVGPASSTDNAIARFDLATGKLIQNSGILIDDSDNMSGVDSITLVEKAAGSTPSSGNLDIYADSTTSLPMAKNDAGDVMQMGGGVYKTISFNAGGMTPRTTNGPASGTEELTTNDIDLDYFDFDAATEEAVQVAFMMPDDWDLGTVKFKLIWKDATTAGTGSVVWGARAVAVGDDDALDATFGTLQSVTNTYNGTAGDNQSTAATPAMTVGGTPALGDLVIFEFYRRAVNGADTYTQDARLLNVTMQYKTLDTVTAAW